MEDISNTLKTVLTNVENDIRNLFASVQNKANTSDVTKTNNRIDALKTQVDGAIVNVAEKNTSDAFIVDFTGAPIQKYDLASCPTGAITFNYANLSGVSDKQASTIEVQLPVDSAVSSINFPSGTQVLDMPTELEPSETSGAYAYHDIVFRNQGGKIYTNHAYKYDEKPDYFWIECLSNSATVYLNEDSWTGEEYNLHLEVSYDNGETWEPWSEYYSELNQGDKMLLRSTQVNTAMNTGEGNFLRFASDGSNDRFNIGGDIMTLVDGTGKTIEVPTDNYFNHFFYQFKVVDASEFKFTSAKKLKYRCFGNMFRDCTYMTASPKVIGRNIISHGTGQGYQSVFNGCTSLTKGPVIEMTSIGAAYRPFQGLFISCSNMNEIEVNFSDWGDNGQGAYLWVQNVQTNQGTFKCPAALPIIRGASNIPNGWTIVNI